MTAQAIGSLFVSLGLDSAAFSAGVKGVQKQASVLAGQLGKVAAGIVATAAPAMAAMGVASINAAAEIQRAARLANAAPAEFQGWAAGAASVGIEQEKLADILKDVNDRVGDFIATGGGPMKDFFERVAPKVGVTAEQFRKLSGPQALQLYVSSLEKANLNQQDMTFFMEAMASDSTALLPLLRGNGAAMAEYAAKAAALGAVMDDKTVASFARAKQSLSEVQMAFTGFRNIMAASVVPMLASVADAFVNAAQKGHWLGDLVRGLADLLPRITTYAASFAAVMGAKWVAGVVAARVATMTLVGALAALRGALIRTGIGAVVVLVGEMVYQIGRWVASVGGMAAAFYALKAKFLGVIGEMADAWIEFTWAVADGMNSLLGTSLSGADATFTHKIALAKKEAEGAAAAAKSAGAAADDASTSFSGFGSGLGQVADKAGGAKEKLSALDKVMKALREEAERLQATMGMSDLQAEIWDKQREAGVKANSVQGKQISGLVTQIDRMKELKDATEEWRSSISGAFSNFITQGGSFKKVLSDIIGKLAEMLAQSAFKSILGNGSSGILGSIIGGLGIGKNANGTNNWRGGLSYVHERGGEIMNLPRGTQVIPHDISKRMADKAASGGSTAIQVSLSPELVGQILQQAGQQSVQIVQANNRSLPTQIEAHNVNRRRR